MKFTKREREILYLMIWDNPSIAKKLNLSVHTIKTYILSIFKKTGAVNRTQALIYCIQRGFISVFDIDTKIADAGFWNENGEYKEEFITNEEHR